MIAIGGRAWLLAAAGLVLAAGMTGCNSAGSRLGATAGSASTSVAPPTTAMSTAPTTVRGQLPTVGDCGGGAYEPATLLIVCGLDGTMATGVRWLSWNPSGAIGTGTIHIVVADQPKQASAHLRLSDPVNGPVGPQFSTLTVTWVGSSPDGHAEESFHLPPG